MSVAVQENIQNNSKGRLKSTIEDKHIGSDNAGEIYQSIEKETTLKPFHSPHRAYIKRSQKAKKIKQSARHRSDPHLHHVNIFKEHLSYKSTLHDRHSLNRSLSDPGKGNLPFFDILGHQEDSFLSYDTVPSTSDIFSSTSTKTKNNDCSAHLPVTTTDSNKNIKLIDALNCSSSTEESIANICSPRVCHESIDFFPEIEIGPSITNEIETDEIHRPTSDVVNLEIEINYTHCDVNFFASINDEDLFTEPDEILYARPFNKYNPSDQDSLNQSRDIHSSIVYPATLKDVDSDSELYKYVEEFSKDKDLRITTGNLSSTSTKEETVPPKSDEESKQIDINVEDNLEHYSEDFIHLETFESDLNDAIKESVDSNTITPIIKKELQYKIQVQRLERGEEELQAEFKEPTTYQLTDEEIKKRNAHREQNRRSAKKGRVKAKQRERELAKILNKASTNIAALTRQARQLKAEKSRLLRELVEHCGVCLKSTLVEHQKKILSSLMF